MAQLPLLTFDNRPTTDDRLCLPIPQPTAINGHDVAELLLDASAYHLFTKANLVKEASDIYSAGIFAPWEIQGITSSVAIRRSKGPGLAKPTALLPEPGLISRGVILDP